MTHSESGIIFHLFTSGALSTNLPLQYDSAKVSRQLVMADDQPPQDDPEVGALAQRVDEIALVPEELGGGRKKGAKKAGRKKGSKNLSEMLSYQSTTFGEKFWLTAYQDGSHALFLKWDNIEKISKERGKEIKTVYTCKYKKE
eukprot:g12449.t1